VLVVLFVARDAILGQLFFVQVTGVTTDASGADVLSPQCEFRVRVVVERRRFPRLRAVAGFALLAKMPFVALLVVVFFVAGVALFGRFLVLLVFVAVRAFHLVVLARQWEFCRAVVKLGLFPVFLCVAVAALLAQASLVYIVLFVA
jgi:hypothetical protein